MTRVRAALSGRPRAGAPRATRSAVSCALAFALATFLLTVAVAPALASAASGPATYQDYRARIAEARRVLQDATPDIADQQVAQKAAADIALLLPATELVASSGRTVVVDNSVLRAYTLELDVAVKEGTRSDLGGRIGTYLASLDAANTPLTDKLRSDPAALAALIAEGVSPARKSLGDVLTEWVAKLTDAVQQWLVANLGARGASIALKTAFWVVTGALAVLVTFLLLRALLRGRRAVAARDAAALDLTSPVVAAAEGLPADILGHADSLAREGRFREAVRALFGGAARELVDRGLLRRTRTRTDAELLADIAPVAPAVTTPLSELTTTFEAAWYGHVDPGEAGFDSARGRYGEVLTAAVARGADVPTEPDSDATAAPDADVTSAPDAAAPATPDAAAPATPLDSGESR
jgi:hypothetical protein